ncbi:MAG: DUF6702 family protein [Planctomycetota bacterium]
MSARGHRLFPRVLAPLGLIILSLCCLAATRHPVLSSHGEAEWNEKTSSLELALCLDAIELEEQVARLQGKKIDLAKPKGLDAVIFGWLNEEFEILNLKQKPFKLSWVGFEMDGPEVWLYFECPLPKTQQEIIISHRVFNEAQPGQMNFFDLKVGKAKAKQFLFSSMDNEKRIRIRLKND